MRAVRYDRLGRAADVLTVVDIESPRPGPGEVRVRLAFSGINPTDWKRRLLGPATPAPTGQIPHQDGAGEIDEVGPGVPAARMGERVWVFHAAWNRAGGTAAEYVTVPADQAITLPANIGLEMGASLGIPYITAHRALTADGPLDGTTVLVTAGAGAVGHAAIQLGTFLGAQAIASVSSLEKAEIALDAGAIAALDYRSGSYVDCLHRHAPQGFDRIIEVALGANLPASLQVLAPRGVIVSYASEEKDPQVPVRALMTLNASFRFFLVYNLTPEQLRLATDDITSALEAGRIEPLPTTVLPLSDAVRAHELVEAGTLGRVLLDVRA